MAGLIKRNQIDGLVAMKALLDNINASYPALKVTTSVIKTPETSVGAGDQVYYTGEELLEELKANVDGILNGGEDLNLPELARRIQQLNAELNGGEYYDTENGTQTLLGFKNKAIQDVVRVNFTWDGTTATATDATLAADEHLDNGQTSLPAYSASGQPIVGVSGATVTFNYNTKTFSAAPYVLDIDATKASGGIDNVTGQVIAGQAVYAAFTGSFKVFPTGTWTLETLPTTALLDNNEMQMVAYDQALQKIAIQIATDKQLIDRVEEAIGEVAIQDAIKNATEVIDSRLDRLEGTDDSNLAKVAVKVSQITGKPAGDDATEDPAETVSKTTAIASKAYVDAVDNAIKADIGDANASVSYDANGKVQTSTVRGEINSIKNKLIYKDQLINSVKTSVTEKQEIEGVETDVQVTDDQNTINETALVTKFAAVDAYATQTRNSLNTFVDTTAPATYVAINKVDDNYSKLTPVGTTYTYTYTDAAHPEVVGKKVFEEKISEIEDNLSATDGAAYLHAAIVPAAAVTADSTTGVTAKAAEATHVTEGVADADMPVLSKLATEYLVQNEAEIRAKAVQDLDDKTYDWNKITGYDGTAKSASIAKTQFNAVTGASADATSTDVLVAAGTAESVDEDTHVYSVTETNALIAAAKAEAMGKEAADKTELLNRIAFNNQQINDALTREITRLTAEAGDTILDPADGTADVVAAADGAITALDKKTADWSNIEVSPGLTQIVDANNNVIQAAIAAESAADANTKFASKKYVDDAILGAKGIAAQELVDAQRELDGRIDALESVTNVTERIVPVTVAGDPAVTTITLSETPINVAQLEILVNGVSYFVADGVMSISNKVITWDDTAAGFKLTDVLDSGEAVVARYQYTDTTKLTPIA